MSIATAIQNAQNKVAAAYTAVANKGGTLPATQNLSNLPTAIASTGIKFGVTIDDMVGKIDANGKLEKQTSTPNLTFTGVKDCGTAALRYRFAMMTLGNISFPDLENVTSPRGLANTFYSSSINSVSFPKLAAVSGSNGMSNCFQATSGTFSLNLSGVVTIGSSSLSALCYEATGLTSFDLSNLETATGGSALNSAFYGCTSLTTASFPKLANIRYSAVLGYCFRGCTNLTSLSFPALNSNSFGAYKNQFGSMLQDVTGCTVHFPSNLQSVIGDWASVTAGFGGTNTTILYDLPATT